MSELRWILLGIGLVLLVLIYVFSRRSSAAEDEPATRHEPTLAADTESETSVNAPRMRSEYSSDPALESDAERFDERATRPDDDEHAVLSAHGSGRFAAPDSGHDPIADAGMTAAAPLDSEVEASPASHDEHRSAGEPPAENTSMPVVPDKVIALHLLPKADGVFDGIDFVGAVQAEGLKFGRFDIFHRFKDPDDVIDSTPSQFSLANMLKPGTFNLTDLDRQQFKGASLFLVLPGPEDAVAAFADMVATGRRLAATLDGQLLDAKGTVLSRQSASHLREDIINYQHGLSATSSE